VYALAASPDFERDALCFAATESGLYRSADGGLTWESAFASLGQAGSAVTTAVAVSPDFRNDRTLFASVPGGILRSHDGGKTWYSTLLPSPPPLVSVLALSPHYVEDGTLFAATMDDGVYRSADRGVRWGAFNFGLLDLHVNCLAISPDYTGDETLLAGTESGIFESTNGGRAWREVDFPMEYAPVLSIVFTRSRTGDRVVLAGTESAGIFRSGDGGVTWQCVFSGADSGPVNALLAAPDLSSGCHVLAVGGDALVCSQDGGETWSAWPLEKPATEAITAIAAPAGLEPGRPLLIGLSASGVRRV
jgi:photosystem II stability/assembly factor-like uncharacterized protein